MLVVAEDGTCGNHHAGVEGAVGAELRVEDLLDLNRGGAVRRWHCHRFHCLYYTMSEDALLRLRDNTAKAPMLVA